MIDGRGDGAAAVEDGGVGERPVEWVGEGSDAAGWDQFDCFIEGAVDVDVSVVERVRGVSA